MTDTTQQLREKIAQLTRSKGQTIDNDSRILVPVTISEITQLATEYAQSLATKRGLAAELTALVWARSNPEDLDYRIFKLNIQLTAKKDEAEDE